MATLSLQIISDLHLETHKSYAEFTFLQTSHNLALIGDIGHVADPQLFTFFETQLDRFSLVFYLLGNHDPWHLDFKFAKKRIREFETKINRRKIRSSKFVFLDQTRYDITETVTILGCTLFSMVSGKQEFEVEDRLVDFKDISKWTIDDHNAAHKSDVAWLNEQVTRIANEDPERKIVILTHHSPTIDTTTFDPKHIDSPVSSAFATDLSKETCWASPAVKAWAFGHTHFNFGIMTDHGKEVFTNQKGYKLLPAKDFNPGKKLVIVR